MSLHKGHFLKWFGMFGLLMLSVGCLSVTQSPPDTTATARPSSTPTHTAEQPVPHSTETPGTDQAPTPQATVAPQEPKTQEPKTQGASTCPSSPSQLSVSYVNSAVLARRVPFSLYLPPCYETSSARLYPVLYLLHGVNADHTQWPDLNVQPDADKLIDQTAIAPLVVVMPGGDYREGEDYGAFVLRDLIPYVERTFHVSSDPHDRAIGGLSEGGYWALELALAHPDLFEAVGGHSPATSSALSDLLGSNRLPELNALRIYLDVGNEDPLAPSLTAFAAALQAHGLAPIFHIYPGAHNRPYWRSHTSEYLGFYTQSW